MHWSRLAAGLTATGLTCLAAACGAGDSGSASGSPSLDSGVASSGDDGPGGKDGQLSQPGADAGGSRPDGGAKADSGSGGPATDAGSKDSAADGGGGSGLSFAGGTNLSGAEFGSVPGVYGTDYIYPPHSDVDYFTGKGFRFFRVPFLWERMQPTLGQALDATELGLLTDLVTYGTSKGATVLIDPHNYARYNNQVIGDTGSTVTAADFATFWGMLAAAFASNPHAVFGLMNEPHDMATELWLADANAAIAAIRGANATNVIFVPGNGWTGAHSWTDNSYGTADSVVMLGVHDPVDNFVYEVHQYLDSDYSGTSATCVSTTIGSQTLTDFTQWMADNHVRGFLGEFGVANNPTCIAALSDMLSYIDQNRALWVGWTWWSAGPWWGNYMYSIEPANGADAPQTATLVQHL